MLPLGFIEDKKNVRVAIHYNSDLHYRQHIPHMHMVWCISAYWLASANLLSILTIRLVSATIAEQWYPNNNSRSLGAVSCDTLWI